MAKTSTASTIPPLSFATGAPILFEDLRAVTEQLNYSAGENPITYFSLITGNAASWGGANDLGTHTIEFTNTSFATVFTGDIYIDADAQTITVEAACVMPATTTAEVRFTVGATNTTLTPFAASSTTRLSASLNVSSTGTGWRQWTIEVRRASGAGTGVLRDVRCQEGFITAGNLPDPANA